MTHCLQNRINSQRQSLLALTALLWLATCAIPAHGAIFYGHFPPTIVPPPATAFPEDAEGTRIFPGLIGPTDYPLALRGELAYTFSAEQLGFGIVPASSLDAVIAVPVGQIGGGFAIPLANGLEIGPDARGYYWMQYQYGLILTANADFGPSGLFTGLESAYIGLQFQQNGQTNYGWVRVGVPFTGLNGGWLYDYAYETSPDTPIQAGQVAEPVFFTANMTGENEIPPNHSANSGTGTFTLECFVGNFVLTYYIELDHSFHPTDAGIFGPSIREGRPPTLISNLGMAQIVIQSPPPSHIVYEGQISLSSNQVVQLQRGQLYINWESAKFKHGELRGQIWPSAPARFSTTLSTHTEFSRNQNVSRGEAQFTLAGTDLSYKIVLDSNFTRIVAGIYDPGFPQGDFRNRMIWLNTTNAMRIPLGGIPNSPGLPGQLLYSGQLTLPDKQIGELLNGQAYLEVLAPGCRNGWVSGRITPTP